MFVSLDQWRLLARRSARTYPSSGTATSVLASRVLALYEPGQVPRTLAEALASWGGGTSAVLRLTPLTAGVAATRCCARRGGAGRGRDTLASDARKRPRLAEGP